jgi:hypothetical protein
MQSRTSRILASLALLICFVCPLVELFDYWDNSVVSGDDTEYRLVILALCVGVAYMLARLAFKSWTSLNFVFRSITVFSVAKPSSCRTGHCRLPLFEDRSPPELPLRI